MELRRFAFLLAWVLVLAPVALKAQNAVHEGMIRLHGSLGIGFSLSEGEQRYLVYSEGEYLVTDEIGVNGAVYGMVGSSETLSFGSETYDSYHHGVFFGPNFHIPTGSPVDIHFALQPGLGISHISYFRGFAPEQAWVVSPVGSVNAGVGYYRSFFHLTFQTRAIAGHLAYPQGQESLGEVRLTMGLGFQFN